MISASIAEKEPWYQLPKEDVATKLATDIGVGLAPDEAAKRLKQYGKNALSETGRTDVLERIARELKNPLTFILLAAGIVTTLLGEYVDATVIFIALIINVAISLYQEGRADQAFAKLKSTLVRHATVVRGGKKRHIRSEDIVLGDLIVIETGVAIPADARIITASNLEVNEAALTGEWIPVVKSDEVYTRVLSAQEQKNMLSMGTFAASGSATAVVTATGDATSLGGIAASLNETRAAKTPIEENVAGIARLLSWIIFGALVGIFALGLFRGEPITELFLISIAIAIAAIPEGLPAAVTVVLAIGMEAILKRGGLVRNLLAAETLGSTTVIITDKTGTLTRAEMRVVRVLTLGSLELKLREAKSEHVETRLEHETHGDERDALEFAALASDAFIEAGEDPAGAHPGIVIRGRPVERAIVSTALDWGLNQTELLANYPRIDFLPFESQYRAAISLNDIRGLKHNRIHMTGAPEYLLSRAGAFYFEGRTRIKTPELMAMFEETLAFYTKRGSRVIGVGFRDTSVKRFHGGGLDVREKLLDGIVFVGFVVLEDPLRDDVKESIHLAKDAHARVIMATGDNHETARAIAEEVGIWRDGDRILLGTEIEGMTEEALTKALKHASVFARVLPEHKLRIVRNLIASGEVVAMTGDGVNDAPALRAASIGVALGSGTEVAKEASDLVLLNNAFSVMVSAIEEGRRIVDNLRKIVAYLLSTSFTEIFVVGGALVAGLPLPLLPAQILWTNMLTEGFMNFAFAFEPRSGDLMRRDPKRVGAREMLDRPFVSFIAVTGVFSGIFLLGFYWFLVSVLQLPIVEARTVTFVALTLETILIAFSLKDLSRPLYAINWFSNLYLIAALLFSVGGLWLGLEWGLLERLLRLETFDVTRAFWPIVFVVATKILVVEGAKFYFFKRRGSTA